MQSTGADGPTSRLIFSVVSDLARDKGVSWLLLVDHHYRPGLLPGLPDLPLAVHRSFPGRAGWKLWYDWQLPRLVRKYRPDMVMLTGGIAAAPLPVPQYLWLPKWAHPKDAREGGLDLPLYASRLEESLRRAERIFCFSEKDRSWLAQRGKDAIVVRPSPPPEVAPLAAAEREAIKGEYAQGKEYFFADATTMEDEDVIYLLKAFSQFKKRQLSNLQLMIAGAPAAGLREKLETYKYRHDVYFYDPDIAGGRLLDAAYAALLPFKDSLGEMVFRAWKAGVPVLVTKPGRLLEIAGPATLGAGASDPAALAGHMMSVYKDEALRAGLIEKGFSRLTAIPHHDPVIDTE